MIENELYHVTEYKVDNPLFSEIESKIDSCFTDCHNKYFHKNKNECIFGVELINVSNN